MNCFCEGDKPTMLKVEGDFGADPIWCDECYSNLEVDELAISSELKKALKMWAMHFGEWVDLDKEELMPNGKEMEERYNVEGEHLTERLQQEVGETYPVRFSPSTITMLY